MRRVDYQKIMLFGGMSIMTTFFGIILTVVSTVEDEDPEAHDPSNVNVIYNSLHIFRMTICFTMIVFACALCIQIFLAYGINYLYIFELDPHNKVTHHQLYKIAIQLYFL